MSDVAPRPPRRRSASLPRQAAEGVGIVTAVALGGAGLGYVIALAVSWVF